MNFNILQYDWLDSTNDEAKRLAVAGAASGTVVVARGQRSGRGQDGRVWESPYGTNIYASLIVRPQCSPADAQGVTVQVGEALAQVVRELVPGAEVTIKLPNDVLLAGKKVAGILCESSVTAGAFDWLVIGFGLNVNQDCRDLPGELAETASSLRDASGQEFDVHAVLRQCLAGIAQALEALAK